MNKGPCNNIKKLLPSLDPKRQRGEVLSEYEERSTGGRASAGRDLSQWVEKNQSTLQILAGEKGLGNR